jgi:DNA polymerase-3 subunit delta'
MSDISLLPVFSSRRLGVIMFADNLLLPAANSLLKITEEPPSHVNLLFMMQNDTLLPTLRSRVRYISVLTNSYMAPNRIPDNDIEWLEWGKNAKEISDIVSSLEKWSNYALENRNAELAFKLERVRLLINTGKLSKSMAQDLVLLAFKEELAVEHLFSDFW